MKKTSILATAALIGALGVSAQNSVVKDAEQAMKGVKTYPEYVKAVEAMTPAFSNPETKDKAQTYYIPGKAGFEVYNQYLLQRQLGQNPDPKEIGHALMDGYNFYLKALPLDSLPDAKGKIKPKYSKKIIDDIVGHVNDFDQVAVGFWQAKDYEGAYEAWDALLDIPGNPRYAKSNIKQFNDTVISEIRFNQALAAWQGQKHDKALVAFDNAIALGNTKAETFEYAYSVAYQAKDKERMKKYARMGLEKHGTADPKFLQWTVNNYIEDKQYDEAAKMLQDAIAADPNNASYHYSFGILNESQKKYPEAKASYEKAIQYNPELAPAYLNLGRVIAEQYDALDQAVDSSMSQSDYNKYFHDTLAPLLKTSAANFEKAYQLNSELTDALQYLRNIYYRLNDGANLERVNALLAQ